MVRGTLQECVRVRGEAILQHERKKERKTKSFSSSFFGFSPSMPVLLGQLLLSADSRVITTSALSLTVCAVTFAVAGPAVNAAPVTSTSAVMVAEHPRKSRGVTDSKEQGLKLASFEDWWASERSTSWPGQLSAS